MLQDMLRSPRMDRKEPKKRYTLKELAQELNEEYDLIYAYIKRHNKNHPEAKITPFRTAVTGRKLYVRAEDAAIIKRAFLHPEEFEEPAW